MDQRVVLQAIADLGLSGEVTDWSHATNAHVHSAWKRLVQSPLHLTVSDNGRVTIADFHMPETESDRRWALLNEPRSSAQAAYWLFEVLGQEVRALLGVRNIDSDETLRRACFTELSHPIDETNEIVTFAGVPIRFGAQLPPHEAWELQVASGKVVGMDDPIWMAKAQAEIDANLNQLFEQTKGR
jgi:hypothetical protein